MEVASESFQLTLPPLNVDTFILPVRNSGFDWKLGISFAEPEVQTILLCCDKIYPPDSSNWKVEARLWITVDGDEGGIPRTVSFQNNLKIQLVAKFLRGIAQEKMKCRITVLKITEKKPDIDFSRPNGRIFSDAIVRVGFEDFHVNKKFLSTYSGYFRKEFFEKKMEQVFIFGQIEAHEFHFLLQYLYHEKKFEDFHAYTMLKLGAFFQVDSLISECIENFTIDKVDNFAVLDALVIADKNDFKDLLEAITNQWKTVNDIPKNLARELRNFKPKNHIFLRKKIGLLKKAALQNPVAPTRNPHDSESEDDPENQDDQDDRQQHPMNPWDLPVHPWSILERVNPWNFPTTMPVPWDHHKGHSDRQNLALDRPIHQNPPAVQVNLQNLPMAHPNLQNLLRARMNPQNPLMNQPNGQNPPVAQVNPQNAPMAHRNPQNAPMAHQNQQNPPLAEVNRQNLPLAQVNPQNAPMAHRNPQNPPVTHPILQNPLMNRPILQNPPMADQNLQNLLRARLNPHNQPMAHPIPQNLAMAHLNRQILPTAHQNPQNPSVTHPILQNPLMDRPTLQNPPMAHPIPQNSPLAHLNPQNLQYLLRTRLIPQNLLMNQPNGQNPPMAQRRLQNPPTAHLNPQNIPMDRSIPQNPPMAHLNSQNPPPAPSLPSSPSLKPQI